MNHVPLYYFMKKNSHKIRFGGVFIILYMLQIKERPKEKNVKMLLYNLLSTFSSGFPGDKNTANCCSVQNSRNTNSMSDK